MRTIAIHQPNYLPYLGFFDKMRKSDIFVILDSADFTDSEFIHRNKIRTKDGWQWLTIPIRHNGSNQIKNIKIADSSWQEKHWKVIHQNYHPKKSNGFQYEVFKELEAIYHSLEFTNLVSVTMEFIRVIKDRLGWVESKTKIFYASELDIDPELKATDRIVTICKTLDGDAYLAGRGSKNYLELEKFIPAGIKIEWQDFTHPIYKQRYEPFIPNLSTIDYLLS